MLILTVKHCRGFESCPTPGVQHGADVRNCTAMGILEIGRRSVWRRRREGWGRNVNKDCIKAEASCFILSLSLAGVCFVILFYFDKFLDY